MSRIDIDNDKVWVSDKVYYHIKSLEQKIFQLEYKLEQERKKKSDIPLEYKVEIYKSFMTPDTDNQYRNLVKLLEEIAEFRTTHTIDEDDKVIVLLPEKSIFSKILKGSDK